MSRYSELYSKGSRSNCNNLLVKTVNGQGKGVFAKRFYKKNAIILQFRGVNTPAYKISDFTHYLQIAPNKYLSPSGNFDDFVNHSCDPNCTVCFKDNYVILKAIRNIRPGEQLSFDYGTIMFNEPTTFDCECYSNKCRKVIGNFYTMPVGVQKYYLKNKMVPILGRFSRKQLHL